MVRRMSSREARANFAELLGSVHYTREPVIVERKGKPYAVLISPEQWEQIRQDQIERGWAAVDAIHERNRDVDPDEVYRDVTAVVEQVRQERYDRGRLPTLTRDALAPEGQEVWDRIAAVRDAVRGPYEVLIRVPALADRVRALEDYFRFDAALSDAERELIILATGRELGARFAWGVHEPRARQVGTRPEAIEAVRDNGALDALTARERLLVELVRALLRERALSDDLYARALADLGERQLVEVVALTGHYSLIGLLLNGFAVPPREGSPGF